MRGRIHRAWLIVWWTVVLGMGFFGLAWGEESRPPKIDTGDTAWVLMSSALVLCMTLPGLALFYGGLVRSKNVLGTIMHTAVILCVISLLWILCGYSLAFGPDKGGLIGGLEWVGLQHVGLEPSSMYATTIPHQVFMMFQLMFAAITVALMTGSIAERMKFKALLIFSVLWSLFIYAPLAHWVWGGGWLAQIGALDFAGGAVVHISSGVSALVCALLLGRRLGFGSEDMRPHNLTYTVLGAGMLWVGWFGFNAGSAGQSNDLAASAFVVTHFSAAAGAVAWAVIEWITRGKASVLGAASGAVAGLVCITPAAGFVQPMPALAMGVVAGVVCYFAVSSLKAKFGYDDSLDAFGVHGVGGTLGAVLTGVFATTAVNGDGANGLFYDAAAGGQLVIAQIVAAAITWGLAIVATFVILKLLDVTMGLRVSQESEIRGLDLAEHGEEGYIFN